MPFPNIGAPELIIILIIALIVLGPGRLPDVAASLGKSLREFRKAASDISDAGKVDTTASSPASPTAPAPNESVVLPPPNPSVPAAPADPNTLAATPQPNQLADPTPSSTPAGDSKP